MVYKLIALLTACCIAGCNTPTVSDFTEFDLGPAPTMSVVGGAGQNVALGAQAVVRVKLVRSNGSPMADASIRFHFLQTVPNQVGGGSIAHRSTGLDGIAEVSFTTTSAGPFSVKAEYPECSNLFVENCGEVVRASATITGTIAAGG